MHSRVHTLCGPYTVGRPVTACLSNSFISERVKIFQPCTVKVL